MSGKDPLSDFDFSKVTGGGSYLKFKPGEPVTVRVLTTNPIVFTSEFEDKKTGEIVLNTKFAWIVYNFTDQAAQVMQTTPNLAKKLGELHKDPDFNEDIKKLDLKISPPEAGVIKAYEVQVLPTAKTLNAAQVKEAQALDLDSMYEEKNGQRMSAYEPAASTDGVDRTSGYEKAKAAADEIKAKDTVVDDFDPNEEINLENIPF